MTSYSLEAHKLAVFFRKKPLFSNLSFSIKSGEILKIIGANGSGKTTLLRVIAGLTPPSEGKIITNVHSLNNTNLTFIPVIPPLKDNLRVFEQLHLWLLLNGELISRARLEPLQRLKKILAYFKLENLWDTPVCYLSAGQRQSLNLCQLFLKHTPIWILDEPFAHLDTQQINIFCTLIKSHILQKGLIIMAFPQDSQLILGTPLYLEQHKPILTIRDKNQW